MYFSVELPPRRISTAKSQLLPAQTRSVVLCVCVCVRHRRLQGLHEHTALTPSCVSEATHTMPGDFGASSHNSKCLRERSNPTNNPCGFHSLEDHTAYTIKNKRLAILLWTFSVQSSFCQQKLFFELKGWHDNKADSKKNETSKRFNQE